MSISIEFDSAIPASVGSASSNIDLPQRIGSDLDMSRTRVIGSMTTSRVLCLILEPESRTAAMILKDYRNFWNHLMEAVPQGLKIYLENQVLGNSLEQYSEGEYIVDRNRHLITHQLENTWVKCFTLDKLKTERHTREVLPVNLITINN